MPASEAGKGDTYRKVDRSAFDAGWDRAFGVSPKSPCVEVCLLDFAREICTGCLRTLDEIGAWSICNDDEKRRILTNVEERKRHAQGNN